VGDDGLEMATTPTNWADALSEQSPGQTESRRWVFADWSTTALWAIASASHSGQRGHSTPGARPLCLHIMPPECSAKAYLYALKIHVIFKYLHFCQTVTFAVRMLVLLFQRITVFLVNENISSISVVKMETLRHIAGEETWPRCRNWEKEMS